MSSPPWVQIPPSPPPAPRPTTTTGRGAARSGNPTVTPAGPLGRDQPKWNRVRSVGNENQASALDGVNTIRPPASSSDQAPGSGA